MAPTAHTGEATSGVGLTAGTLSAALYSVAGGYADALGFLTTGNFTGHITGNLALLSVALGKGEWNTVLRPLIAIVLFLLASTAGLWLSTWKGTNTAIGAMFLVQCIALTASSFLVMHDAQWKTIALLAALCVCLGLQNGMISEVAGTTIHTTYVSGDITRFLHFLKSTSVPRPRSGVETSRSPASLSAAVVICFVLGAFLATLAYRHLPNVATCLLLLPLAAATIAMTTAPRASATNRPL